MLHRKANIQIQPAVVEPEKDSTSTTNETESTMVRPFIDLDLERKILRHLIFNHEVDNEDIEKEMTANAGYIVGIGEPNEIFSDEFHKNIFEEVVNSFMKFAESTSRKNLIEWVTDKYGEKKDELEKQMILFELIFAQKFEAKRFKFFFEKIKNNYHFRILYHENLGLNTKLKWIFEKKGKETPIQLATDMEDVVEKIMKSTYQSKVIEQDIFQTVEEDIALLRKKKENPKDFEGIPTGFNCIDSIMGGFFPGELIVVLGRPGTGKSVLLLNFGTNAYFANYDVIYVTVEMALEMQKQRFYSLITKTDYSKLKFPQRMEKEEIDQIEKLIIKEKNRHKNHFWFIDAPQQCTSAFLESRVNAFQNLTGRKCGLLIIDPLYLLSPTIQPQDGDNVGQVTIDLKLLARKFKMPVIAASQTNRSGGARHRRSENADTADAAFSDKIGQNADNVIFITGDKRENSSGIGGLTKLQFAKTRDSKMSSLVFRTRFDIMKFIYEVNSSSQTASTEAH